MQRAFRFSRVFNFRDVGGYPAHAGRAVRWRRLFRSDALSGLTDEDRPAFEALGVRTVVDLRRPRELAAQGRVPDWNGIAYHNIAPEHREWTQTPYVDGTDPRRYLADRYRDMVEEGAAGFAEVIRVLADERAAPVVVHCVAGKDRTGLVCALTLAALGVPDEVIDDDYAQSTENNRRWVAWAQQNGHPEIEFQPWFASPPGTMKLFLGELRERYGSVERYLTTAGLERDQLDALRNHLLA
ncbi:MAG TPA: tyrosine-protein phosphatase [Natronosporangium sp.]